MDSRTVIVTYNHDTDTLYITLEGCRGGFGDSPDGRYFFAFYDSRDRVVPVAFEVHWFSKVWNRDSLIPDWDVCFDVKGTELEGVNLRELLAWSFEHFVASRATAKT